jgi:dihydroxyacetone kinase-like predicted kinase
VRATKVNGLHIKRRQPIGLLDDELVAAGTTELDVINQVLAKLDLEDAEVVTIYYGEDTEAADAEEVSTSITQQYPQLQIEIIKGNQPHYSYIISVE